MKMREIDRCGYDLEGDMTKIVIRRKAYDLQAAHAIVKAWVVNAFCGGSETLYKTPEGHYFVVVNLGMGLKPKLVPRTLHQARTWLERVQNPPRVLELS